MRVRNPETARPGEGLNVLILSIEYPPRAGAGTHVHELIKGLSRLGCEVTLIAPTTGEPRSYREFDAQVYLIPPSVKTCEQASHLSKVQGVVAVNEDLIANAQALISGEKLRPNLIHCHDWYTYPAACELRRIFGLPVVGTAHSTSEPIVRWWGETPDPEVLAQENNFYLNAEALITVSRSMASLICTTHGTREERLNVIHNGFDFDSFAKPLLGPAEAKLLRSTVAASDEKIILFAGRLTSQKGIEALLASTARLLDEGLTARLVLAGEPDSHNSAKNIERLLDQFSALRRQITMLGRLPRKRLALLYQVADIAVVPSVYEPFGYAAVEAMTMGVPVVAADAGGLPEIIAHNQTGMLVPLLPNGSGKHTVDVAELASAESTLLRDDALRNRIGQTGKQHVAQVFNLETMSRRTLEVYRSMAATRPIRSFI